MKNFIAPSIEFTKFEDVDIIATSETLSIYDDTVDNYQSRDFWFSADEESWDW